jgi:hypothetical protein
MSKKAVRPHIWRQRLFLSESSPHEASESSIFNRNGWAARGEEIDDANTLWRQYVILVDLYRYYIDLVWKVSIWYYTAMGVSLAYLFTHLNGKNQAYLPLLLFFLSALSIGVALIFSRVIYFVSQMEQWLEYIAVSLRLPGRPHIEFIRWFCRFTAATLFVIAISCVGLFAYLHAR